MKFQFQNFILLLMVSFAMNIFVLLLGGSVPLDLILGFLLGFFWERITGLPILIDKK